MALRGVDVILYPTAIGSEPQDPSWYSCAHWQRAMQGHAAANFVPVIAANRVGIECGSARAGRGGTEVTFYGSSFVTDGTGAMVSQAGRTEEALRIAELDVEGNQRMRREWGLFRDRRPDLYSPLLTLDGRG